MDNITGKQVSTGDLRVVAHPGDNMVLLAMSLDESKLGSPGRELAGFAIFRSGKGTPEVPLLNRLNFGTKLTHKIAPAQRRFTPSDQAPLQKFRWVDLPPDGFEGAITYRVVARYFTGQGWELTDGDSATVTVAPPAQAHAKFGIAFTRGCAAAQAYADRFGEDRGLRPQAAKSAQFNTEPFQARYRWLGAAARTCLFEFLDECRNDRSAKIDVFAHDLDEPDVIKALCEFGTQQRLRLVLDDAPVHTRSGAIEIEAAALIEAAAGAANLKRGHFKGLQQHKMLIKRNALGKAQKVLFGSIDFSLRGLYVQANHVIVIDDPAAAGSFAQAFDNAFQNDVAAAAFQADAVAQGYNHVSTGAAPELPSAAVAFAPHPHALVSLGQVANAIQQAQSLVLYSVMQASGAGELLACLRAVAANPVVLSCGTVETSKGLAVQNATGQMGAVNSYAFLKSKLPEPFRSEWSGGAGQPIDHKFVVIDPHGVQPVVFTGSASFAADDEEANGASLLVVRDPFVAGLYAIEALRLIDYYAFRAALAQATDARPLTLWHPAKADSAVPWYQPYYDPTHVKFRERCLLAEVAMPAELKAQKNPDWTALLGVSAESATTAAKEGAAAAAASGPPPEKPAATEAPGPAAVEKPTAAPAAAEEEDVRTAAGVTPVAEAAQPAGVEAAAPQPAPAVEAATPQATTEAPAAEPARRAQAAAPATGEDASAPVLARAAEPLAATSERAPGAEAAPAAAAAPVAERAEEAAAGPAAVGEPEADAATATEQPMPRAEEPIALEEKPTAAEEAPAAQPESEQERAPEPEAKEEPALEAKEESAVKPEPKEKPAAKPEPKEEPKPKPADKKKPKPAPKKKPKPKPAPKKKPAAKKPAPKKKPKPKPVPKKKPAAKKPLPKKKQKPKPAPKKKPAAKKAAKKPAPLKKKPRAATPRAKTARKR